MLKVPDYLKGLLMDTELSLEMKSAETHLVPVIATRECPKPLRLIHHLKVYQGENLSH